MSVTSYVRVRGDSSFAAGKRRLVTRIACESSSSSSESIAARGLFGDQSLLAIFPSSELSMRNAAFSRWPGLLSDSSGVGVRSSFCGVAGTSSASLICSEEALMLEKKQSSTCESFSGFFVEWFWGSRGRHRTLSWRASESFSEEA